MYFVKTNYRHQNKGRLEPMQVTITSSFGTEMLIGA